MHVITIAKLKHYADEISSGGESTPIVLKNRIKFETYSILKAKCFSFIIRDARKVNFIFIFAFKIKRPINL